MRHLGRTILGLLALLSLASCLAAVALWVRSHRVPDRAGFVVDGHFHSLVSQAGVLTLFGPPPVPAFPAYFGAGEAARAAARLRNEDIEWAAMLVNNERIGNDHPTQMVYPDYVRPGRGSAAELLGGPATGTASVRLLLAALGRPDVFVAAHVLLVRRFDPPDVQYDSGRTGWTWDDEPGQLWHHPKGFRGPARGTFRGLRIELRLPDNPADDNFGFSGSLPYPCLVRIDPAQQPAIRDQWHRRLDVPVASVRFAYLAGASAIPAVLWTLMAIRRRLGQRSARRQNRCTTCGYDLRATPDRCPECGTMPTPTST